MSKTANDVQVSEADLKAAGEKLKDWKWRINNLYFITDKNGRTVRFKMNKAQEDLFDKMHHRNIVLKARQLGMTTFAMIFMLDAALFRPNTRCAIICHSKDDAARLFDEKVKFAYRLLPESIRSLVPAVNDRAGELKFSNGSSLTVGTSFRGGTLRYLHISEFGKICAKYPDKAREIVTGAFEAVGKGGVVTIESTAEGRSGYFFDYSVQAEKDQLAEKILSALDWKFFFFPWYDDPQYVIEEGEDILERINDYFDQLTFKTGQVFTEGQRRWYQLKEKTLGHDMKREYPSTPEEAFEQSLEGAYYERQFRDLYSRKQITSVPYDPATSVHTFWDIGVNDKNGIWFMQLCGREWHAINYYENSGEGLEHYADVLNEYREKYGYKYGTHVGPHDLAVREWGADGKTRLESALAKGIRFEIASRLPVADGIESVRNILPMCWFDESKCEIGLKHLQSYRKEWDAKHGIWKSKPLHDEASNCADAFRYFAVTSTYVQDQYSNVVQFKAQPTINSSAWT
ncbi:MAG: hypothetical protein WCF45_10675 [Photobacterium halotolerans]